MVYGSLGDIYFVSSNDELRTISEFQRKFSARYTEHAVLQGKPRLEFVGPGGEEMSFKIQFHTSYGMDPEAEIDNFRDYVETGAALDLIIDGSPVGDNLWVITDGTVGAVRHGRTGNIIFCELTLTLKEYVQDSVNMMKEVASS